MTNLEPFRLAPMQQCSLQLSGVIQCKFAIIICGLDYLPIYKVNDTQALAEVTQICFHIVTPSAALLQINITLYL